MSQAASVGVVITPGGRITDITIGGQSIAAAVGVHGTELHAYPYHGGDQTMLTLILVVDEITIAPKEGQ